MLDIPTVTALASSAVAVLTPLLKKALEKGVEEIGKSSASTLFDKLKQRLGHEDAKKALTDLAEQPDDPDAQGALRLQLRKALADDPGLAAFLTEWTNECGSAAGISQTANVHGDHNKTTQIAGSGNSVA